MEPPMGDMYAAACLCSVPGIQGSTGGGGTPLQPLAPVISPYLSDVEIVRPLNQSGYPIQDSNWVDVETCDPDGFLQKVELYASSYQGPFTFILHGLSSGTHPLEEMAYENEGNTSLSPLIHVNLTRHGKGMYLLRLVNTQKSFEKIIVVH